MNNPKPDNPKKVKGDSYYGRTASDYQKRRKKQELWKLEQKAMQELLNGLPDELKVVDIPFGTGRFVPYYIDHKYDIYGLDASNEMLKQAKVELGDEAYSKCKLQVGFSNELPYKDKEFDLLVSCRFLRDIIPFGQGKQSLAEFARVTKSYAILQLGEEIKSTDDYPPDDERWSSRLNANQTEELLSEYGFELKEKVLVKASPEVNSNINFYLCHLSK